MDNQRERSFRNMLSANRALFWDTRIDALDRNANRCYIIARLLNLGGIPGLDWVEDNYSADEIADAVIHRRDLHPIVRNFMAERYHIPKERLNQGAPWR